MTIGERERKPPAASRGVTKMSTVQQRLLTAGEFFDLPEPTDGSVQELVRGEVVTMPGPGFEHGEVQVNVAFAIKGYLKPNPIGRVVSESGTITERNPDTVRGPDVSFYSKERIPLDARVVKYPEQSPDLCVEIVSPSNTKRRLREKIKEYFVAGVRMVWLVDPEDRSVTVLRAPDEGRLLYEGATLDGGDVLPGFSCKVADLFA
jgi:Uma2 family endonuclease